MSFLHRNALIVLGHTLSALSYLIEMSRKYALDRETLIEFFHLLVNFYLLISM